MFTIAVRVAENGYIVEYFPEEGAHETYIAQERHDMEKLVSWLVSDETA